MGDVSIIARRLKDGHVQYGWSGNGGYYQSVGNRLYCWYDEKDDNLIEYLFGLGELRHLGKPGSEKGGETWINTHELAGTSHHLGTTEREIFSRIAFIDYGYFYDLDQEWYYVEPGPFRIKIPLELIHNNLDERYYEFDFLRQLQRDILHYIYYEYTQKDEEFKALLEGRDIDTEYQALVESDHPVYDFWKKYRNIFSYFDDWIVIRCDEERKNVTEIVMRKKSENREETIEW